MNSFTDIWSTVRKLLLHEPPNRRIRECEVQTVSGDSFGEAREIVKRWTSEADGVFTDDLHGHVPNSLRAEGLRTITAGIGNRYFQCSLARESHL